jgi:hypothetical protein
MTDPSGSLDIRPEVGRDAAADHFAPARSEPAKKVENDCASLILRRSDGEDAMALPPRNRPSGRTDGAAAVD